MVACIAAIITRERRRRPRFGLFVSFFYDDLKTHRQTLCAAAVARRAARKTQQQLACMQKIAEENRVH